MKIANVFNFLKWTMAWTATWTLLMAPLAMAQEAQRVSKQQMQSVMDQLGLNKQITLGEFYQKNKYLFPVRIQKEIGPLFTEFKNQLMPTFEVLSSKTTSGEEIATIRVTQGAELLTIQWFGEQERMLKFQNTNLNETDVVNFNDMFTRIFAGDEKIRKQVEQNVEQNTVKPKTSKYPDVTKAEWKSMSARDKANYIVTLRSLWLDARQVLRTKNNLKKASKSSQNFFEKNRYFFALFMGSDAEAAEKTIATGKKSGNYFSGQSCIVAGYVARYEKSGNGEVCNHKVIDQVYDNKDNSLYKKAKEFCQASGQGSGRIACNPYVYGTPNGAPTCVTPTLADSSFQKATHWDGPCDSSSRLQSSKNEIEILKDKSKLNGRYEDGNLMSEQERKELFKAEQGDNLKHTEEYLLGILKFRGTVKSDVKSLFDSGVLSDEVYEQIKLDKKAFDFEIAEAQKSCKMESEASKSGPRVHEKNYWQACDQLHRRFSFVTELLFESKCDGKKLNPSTLKCVCDKAPIADQATPAAPVSAPPKTDFLTGIKPEVVPGASCSVVLPPTVPSINAVSTESTTADSPDCEAQYPGASVSGNKCLCASGKAPKKEVTDDATGQESWSCASDAVTKPDKAKDDCNLACKVWKFIKKVALPVLVTGAAIYAGYALIKNLAPKKPALNPPLDKCPGAGTPPQCIQVCAPPLAQQSNGTCACSACPPGQNSPPSTCICASGAVPGAGQTYLCPDATTQVANLDSCPTYACWNGQSYQNPMNCPPQAPTIPASSGTSN